MKRDPCVDGRRGGFTLVEIIVVLILLGLATGLVAPAMIVREREDASQLTELVRDVRDLAARRGQILHLHLAAGGTWTVEGAASAEDGVIANGRIDDYPGPSFTLAVSPLGTCGFDVRSTEAALAMPLDPLTCEPVAGIRIQSPRSSHATSTSLSRASIAYTA